MNKYIELPREKITFYGDTKAKKKANELIFDLSLENDRLYQENKDLQQRIDKAIEYINDNVEVYAFNNKDLPHWEFNDDNMKDLLEILGGKE